MASAENIYDELDWRGLLFQESGVNEVRDYLINNKIALYCGFDPTSDSLHIGNLVPLITLRRFQEFGHRALPLAGGATGMIGDPSGKSAERNLQTPETIRHNVECIKGQLAQIIDFKDTDAELVNNYDWISKIDIITFLRDIGKYFSVNTMLQKDSVSSRISGEGDGISYTEFTYQVLQGYDFLHLNREYGCTMQIGGSDQWGNMTAGTDLIRRCTDSKGYVLTVPLITTADGKKFGKSEKGAIYLDPKKTCPFDFYQYWINAQDADVIKLLKFFTFLSKEEIEELEKKTEEEPHLREAQKRLAQEMTVMIHGQEEFEKAVNATNVLFGRGGDIKAIDASTFASLQEATEGPTYSSLEDIKGLLQILGDSKLSSSMRDARTHVKGNGVSINNEKITDESYKISTSDLLAGHYMLIKRGKKNFTVVKVG